MILRRFSKHVSDQNWFAVGLDVIVVVVGIFLGMQVTEWQSEQKGRTKAQSYLENLNQNLLQDIDFHEQRIESVESILSEISSLSNDLSNNNNKQVTNIATLFLSTHRVRLETATIENLKSTGTLNLINNKIITEELLKYYSEVGTREAAWYNAMAEYGRTQFGPYIMKKYSIDYSLPFYQYDNNENLLTTGKLRKDIFLINALQFRQIAFTSLRAISLDAISRASKITEEIKKTLNN